MRFKNYRNSYNKQNRILSEDDIWQMAIGEAFDREDEIMSQYNAIGLPLRAELESSPNTRWVEPFTNELNKPDGGYWESILDEIEQEPSTSVDSSINNQLQEPTPLLKSGIEKTAMRTPEVINKLQNTAHAMTDMVNTGADKLKSQVKTKLEPVVKTVKNTMGKYEGLTPVEAAAKATSKIPINWTAQQYYGHAAHLADGEEPSLYMKKNNDFYKYGDIEDENVQELLKAQAAKMKGVDLNDPDLNEKIKDVDVVIPKPDSDLVKKIKNSDEFKKFVVENYGDLMNNSEINSGAEYPFLNLNLWATLHKSNWNKLENSDDISNNDIYNFEKWDRPVYKDLQHTQNGANITNYVKENFKILGKDTSARFNNLGFEQQRKGQLGNYLLSPMINLTEEERRKIVNEYLRKKLK